MAVEALTVEPKRFVSLIDTFSSEWNNNNPRLERVDASLKWVAIINRCGTLFFRMMNVKWMPE